MSKISAIIACYRDAPAVPYMHQRLTTVFKKIGVDYEIIFVNDCSPDNAKEVLFGLSQQDPHVIVINHSRNFGSQNAFTSGMKIASGDAVVLLDGDLQDPPELIESFFYKWREGYDVVYGTRVKRDATLFLQVAYKAFYRVFRAASYIPMPLDAGDFSLIDRKVVNAMNALPETGRFLRGLRSWVGFKQIGVPYVRPERMFGVTTNNLWRNLGWARKAIFSFSYVAFDLMFILSFVIVLIAIILIALQVSLKLLFPQIAPSGLTTVIVLILFMGGVQMLCFAVLGSYIAHIYDEVKQRPAYIVESMFNQPSQVTLPSTHTPNDKS